MAVVAGDLSLDNYAPLPLLRSAHDWGAFVSGSLDEQANDALRQMSKGFVERVLVPGDAAQGAAVLGTPRRREVRRLRRFVLVDWRWRKNFVSPIHR